MKVIIRKTIKQWILANLKNWLKGNFIYTKRTEATLTNCALTDYTWQTKEGVNECNYTFTYGEFK